MGFSRPARRLARWWRRRRLEHSFFLPNHTSLSASRSHPCRSCIVVNKSCLLKHRRFLIRHPWIPCGAQVSTSLIEAAGAGSPCLCHCGRDSRRWQRHPPVHHTFSMHGTHPYLPTHGDPKLNLQSRASISVASLVIEDGKGCPGNRLTLGRVAIPPSSRSRSPHSSSNPFRDTNSRGHRSGCFLTTSTTWQPAIPAIEWPSSRIWSVDGGLHQSFATQGLKPTGASALPLAYIHGWASIRGTTTGVGQLDD